MKFLIESGIRIPEEIGVVGYDNNDISTGVVPTLTTVDNRLKEAGESVAEALLNLIKGEKDSVRQSIVPVLVERRSHADSSRSPKSSCAG
jgi:LacI family transcriptional regulator